MLRKFPRQAVEQLIHEAFLQRRRQIKRVHRHLALHQLLDRIVHNRMIMAKRQGSRPGQTVIVDPAVHIRYMNALRLKNGDGDASWIGASVGFS
ncbi:hypothetical protein D3C80_1880770 [compost metagenome]